MAVARASVLEEHAALVAKQKQGPLTPEEEQRLELLRDVLLELSALQPPESTKRIRRARADLVLEVSFATAQTLIQAYSQNIGTGGIALKTASPQPVGAEIELRIRLPESAQPSVVRGRVAWAKADSMGVEFTEIADADVRQLKELLTRDAPLLGRIRSLLKQDVRELGRPAEPLAADATVVDTRPVVLVRLSDPQLASVVMSVLEQTGIRAIGEAGTERYAVAVTDASTALEVVIGLGVRMVLVNVSGPDALVGTLARVRPSAYVRRPATAAEIQATVVSMLKELGQAPPERDGG